MASRCACVSQERFEFASETSWVAVAAVRVVVLVVVGAGGPCLATDTSSHTAGGASCGSPKVFVCVCGTEIDRREIANEHPPAPPPRSHHT